MSCLWDSSILSCALLLCLLLSFHYAHCSVVFHCVTVSQLLNQFFSKWNVSNFWLLKLCYCKHSHTYLLVLWLVSWDMHTFKLSQYCHIHSFPELYQVKLQNSSRWDIQLFLILLNIWYCLFHFSNSSVVK